MFPFCRWSALSIPFLAHLFAQQDAVQSDALRKALDFEQGASASGSPAGWSGGPPQTVFADDNVSHGGKWSARLERRQDTGSAFSAITNSTAMDFAGKAVELRGFVRTQKVQQWVGLWMREDGDTPALAFENMQNRRVGGTADWKEYSIVLPIRPGAKRLFFGFLLAGPGKAWVDDMRLLVDGKPVWEAPKAAREKTILETDIEFDQGSRIKLDALSPLQIESLTRLGKVWGFLKYHHPSVTSGERHWDYDLFRVLPAVLKAPNRDSANAVLLTWVNELGPPKCAPCGVLGAAALHLAPPLDWLSNDPALGNPLRDSLRKIYANRSGGKQFYVWQAFGVNNPVFDRESAYYSQPFPDAGFQLLALYRFWNIIQYWFPYRDVIGEDWDAVLREFVPRLALAKDKNQYQLELMQLIARVHDTHANLWSSLNIRPPLGVCSLPVTLRFVENQPVVTRATGGVLRVGDVLKELDGKPIPALIAQWSPYYADSNEAARSRDIARGMTKGECGPAALRVLRDGEPVDLEATRERLDPREFAGTTHDLPGSTFRLLSPEVAYLKLSSVKAAEAVHYIESAAGTKGLIIDMRNYPSAFMVFALGALLVERPTPFVRFTISDLANPGAFRWGDEISLQSAKPHYAGKVVILVDETSQSQAEYTAMAFRAVPGAKVVGSTTAGADGNVSPIPLPGGLSSVISGIGVFYPDKTPTQRVGIVPDVLVLPTVTGIRDGRDEVLETGLRQILGPEISEIAIRVLTKP